MSDSIRELTEAEREERFVAKRFLDGIQAEFGTVMAYMNGDLDVVIDGKRVRFRVLSVEDVAQ